MNSEHGEIDIQQLDTNPNFDLYLKFLESAIRNRNGINELQEWWGNNYHHLTCGKALNEFSSFLENVLINASNNPSSQNPFIGNQPAILPIANYSNKFPFFPWADKFLAINKDCDTNATQNLLMDYAKYLQRYAPITQNAQNKVRNKSNLNFADEEYNHLSNISAWVSNLSGIEYCQSVFDTILENKNCLKNDTGKLFKAATQCPHKLFRLFMESNFTDYDFQNGEALMHLISLPLAVNPNDDDHAYLTPDYPFFDRDIFPDKFNVPPHIQLGLTTAWKNFYTKYNLLCGEKSNKQIFINGHALFALSVSSLLDDNSSPTPVELNKIFTKINPNIWCVQYWLHSIILSYNSKDLQLIYMERLMEGGQVSPVVDYFFELAQVIFKKDWVDLSSRVLTIGLMQLICWPDPRNESTIPEICARIKKYFPLILKHSRTDALYLMRSTLMDQINNIGRKTEQPIINHYFYDLVKVIDGDLSFITYKKKYMDRKTKKKIIASKLLEYHRDDISTVIEEMMHYFVGAMNTFGGEIGYTCHMEIYNNLQTIFDKYIITPLTKQDYLFIELFRASPGRGILSIRNRTFWANAHRGSKPVFIKKGDGQVYLTLYNYITEQPIIIQDHDEISEIISRRFPIYDGINPVILTW